MRQSRKMMLWGLGLFLTLLLFTTVFSQEQSDAAGADGVAVETAVGDPAAEQPASPGADKASGATLGQTKNRPSNIPELTAFIRKSLKEHPILTNLWLLGILPVFDLRVFQRSSDIYLASDYEQGNRRRSSRAAEGEKS